MNEEKSFAILCALKYTYMMVYVGVVVLGTVYTLQTHAAQIIFPFYTHTECIVYLK